MIPTCCCLNCSRHAISCSLVCGLHRLWKSCIAKSHTSDGWSRSRHCRGKLFLSTSFTLTITSSSRAICRLEANMAAIKPFSSIKAILIHLHSNTLMQKRALSAQQSPLAIVQAGVSCLKHEGIKLGKLLMDENKSGPLIASLVFLLIVAVIFIRWWRKDKVFLLDFECFKTQKEKHVSYQRFEQGSRDSGFFTQEALDFQTRMLSKSGLSEETCFPMGLHKDPPISTMTLARQEAEEVIFSVVENLFERTGLRPRDIDVVVVNCSLFNPTPSLSAMIVNKFKMRTNV